MKAKKLLPLVTAFLIGVILADTSFTAQAASKNVMITVPSVESYSTTHRTAEAQLMSEEKTKGKKTLTFRSSLSSTYGLIAGATANVTFSCFDKNGTKYAAKFNDTITFFTSDGKVSYTKIRKAKDGEDALHSEYSGEIYVNSISVSTVCSKKGYETKTLSNSSKHPK